MEISNNLKVDAIRTLIKLSQLAAETVQSNKMIRQWVSFIKNRVGEITFSSINSRLQLH